MGLPLIVTMALAGLLAAACSADSDGGRESVTLENTDAPCIPDGAAKVEAFYRAINQNDSQAVREMFIESGLEFTVAPDILVSAETSVLAADAAHKSAQTFTPDGIEEVMSQQRGLRFELQALGAWSNFEEVGPASTERLLLGFGPLSWRATGQPLTERGKRVVNGGGKIAIDCKTGLLQKVLLSPLTFE